MAKSEKKVRQPKGKAKAKAEAKEPEANEEEAAEETEQEEKVEPKSAIVYLKSCNSLRKHGRVYTKDYRFTVYGEDEISYFQADSHFEVLVQK